MPLATATATATAIDVRWPVARIGAAVRHAAPTRRGVLLAVTMPIAAGTAHGLGEASPLEGNADELDDAAAVAAELSRALATRAWDGATWSDCAAVAAAVAGHRPALRFAVETALAGALASSRSVGLGELLCPRAARRVPVNAVVSSVDEARAAHARGVAAFKLKLGDDTDADVRLARELRRAFPAARLRGDANRGWPRAEARDRLRAFAAAGLQYIEEPCVDTAALLDDATLPAVALDESLVEIDEATLGACLRAPALAALIIKPTSVGGMARALALAERARAAGKLAVTTHALEGPVATAACAELARAIAADLPDEPVGLDRHPALAAWPVAPPQLRGGEVVAAGAGLALEHELPLLRRWIERAAGGA